MSGRLGEEFCRFDGAVTVIWFSEWKLAREGEGEREGKGGREREGEGEGEGEGENEEEGEGGETQREREEEEERPKKRVRGRERKRIHAYVPYIHILHAQMHVKSLNLYTPSHPNPRMMAPPVR